MAQETPDIIYTIVDEAPELARGSLLPIITSFSEAAGINVETRDISVAARILALFPELLSDDQKVSGRVGENPRSQRDQTAKRLGLRTATRSRDQRIAVARLPDPVLPGRSANRRRKGDPRQIRHDQRLRREPGSARRELGSSLRQSRERIRQGQPAPHGHMDFSLQNHGRLDAGQRLFRQ